MDSSRLAFLERCIRLLKIWNLILGVLLLVSLGANAAWVRAASDPPIRVYTATLNDNGGGGGYSFDQAVVVTPEYTTESPLTLIHLRTSHLSNHDHTCLVTGSANVRRTMNGQGGTLILGLTSTRREIRPARASMAHLVTTPDQDLESEEVTVTFAFTRLRGDQSIRLKAAVLGTPLIVANASMTVICLRDRI